MPAPPPPLHHLHPQFGPYAASEILADAYVPPFEPGDRVGGPPPRKRRRARGALLLITLAGLAAWFARERGDEVTALVSQATAMLEGMKPERRIARPSADEASRTIEPLPAPEPDAAPAPALPPPRADDKAEAEVPKPAASLAPPATPPEAAATSPDPQPAVERLPDIVANPADPLQQKALAAGLHPALSRALLEQLTPEDFRNAAYAVKVVLKGDKADNPFVWPKRQVPRQARFKIRLVEGAPSECRRYVVQVAKDGWETTARPMERCGAVQTFKPS